MMFKRALFAVYFFIIAFLSMAVVYADECGKLADEANTLLSQAEAAYQKGDTSTALALVNAAKAVLAPCLASKDCPAAAQVNTLLGQITTSQDAKSAGAIASGAKALLAPCLTAPGTTQPGAVPTNLIAFVSSRDGNNEIYTMNPDGTNARRLTNNTLSDFAPYWSPDGSQLVYITEVSTGRFEIMVMNWDGTNPRQLTTTGYNLSPAWSPDGRKIAYTSRRVNNFEIMVMNSDGTGSRNLTNNSASDLSPAWSPDGKKIAFHSNRDGNYEIYAMNADGTKPGRLTDNRKNSYWPSWSPDGSEIAFMSDFEGNFEIYVVSAAGRNQRRVTNNAASDANPSWSPDGTQILFDRTISGRPQIMIVNKDGTNTRKLSQDSTTRDFRAIWQNGKSTSQLALSPTTAAPGTDKPVLYTSKKRTFSFEYPSDWKGIPFESSAGIVYVASTINAQAVDVVGATTIKSGELGLRIMVSKLASTLSADPLTYVSALAKTVYKNDTPSTAKAITVNGHKGAYVDIRAKGIRFAVIEFGDRNVGIVIVHSNTLEMASQWEAALPIIQSLKLVGPTA
jgi:Tol biopolymer transport system component